MKISDIIISEEIYPRENFNPETVKRYKDAMEEISEKALELRAEGLTQEEVVMVRIFLWSIILTPEHVPSPLEEAINNILTEWVKRFSSYLTNPLLKTKTEQISNVIKKELIEGCYLNNYDASNFLERTKEWLNYHVGKGICDNIHHLIHNIIDDGKIY